MGDPVSNKHPYQPDDEMGFRAQRARALSKVLLRRSRRRFLRGGLTFLAGGVAAGAAYGILKFGFNVNVASIEKLLADANIVDIGEVSRLVEHMDRTGELAGAKLIARAWTDDDFKKALLTDADAAIDRANIGIGPENLPLKPAHYEIRFVENTRETHNLVVCTLCSCYPTNLLGTPPMWYRSREYRYRALKEPRNLLRELGLNLPDSVSIVVHDSNVDIRYAVLPRRPDYTAGWGEEQLEKIVTRDVMIGVRSF